MKNYTVTATIIGRHDGATPVDCKWYQGESHAAALAALVSAAAQDPDEPSTLPDDMRYRVLSVALTIAEQD